jgi:two-component system KDP operon response regulator KdpE
MNRTAPSILVIDDEIQMRRMLRISLENAGHRVFEAASGEEGLVEAASRRPETILLDLTLPDMDGLALLKRLREWYTSPILILSVRDNPDEKIKALDAGADDYVTKPFHTDELLARLRVARRHASPQDAVQAFEHGELVVDLAQRTVQVRGVAVDLTPTEYSLLRLLVTHAGKVLTHAHVLREIWGPKSSQAQYLRVYVSQLRSKLAAAGVDPKLIKTESGVGYRLQAKN